MTKTITVKGKGSYSAKADYVKLTMDLETVNRQYDASVKGNAEKLDMLCEAISSLGFSKDDVKTTWFDIRSEYDNKRDRNGNYTSVFSGYRCCHTLAIEFDFDSELLGRLINAISSGISNPDIKIDFTVKDKNEVCEELLISATENARRKAEIISKASGVTLGDLVTIDYNWGELSLYSDTDFRVGGLCDMECSAPMRIVPRDIEVNDTVTFVWEIK